MKNLVFGNYNLDTDLVVVSRVVGTGESMVRAENDVKKTLEKIKIIHTIYY